MIRLVRFEWHKAFLRFSILALLLIFTVIDVGKVRSTYLENSYLAEKNVWREVYWNLYEEYSGEMTREKIDRLLALYRPLQEQTADLTATTAHDIAGTLTGNIWSDMNLLKRYYVQSMQYCYTYQNIAVEVTQRAKENIALFHSLDDRYETEKNSRIAEIYSGRRIGSFYYTEGALNYVYYDFSTMLVLLLCIYGLSQIFPRERESGMDRLLLTCPGGGARTIVAKLLAGATFTIGISLWFSVVDVLSFSVFFGFGGSLSLPVYALENLAYASVRLTLWQYALISALCRAFGVWVVGMMLLLVSLFFSNALIPMIAGVAGTTGLILAGVRWGYSQAVWPLVLNPYSLMVGRLLYGRTEFVRFLGIPLLSWEAALLWAAVLSICLILALLYLGTRKGRWHI